MRKQDFAKVVWNHWLTRTAWHALDNFSAPSAVRATFSLMVVMASIPVKSAM